MSRNASSAKDDAAGGGLARWFVENPGAGWAAIVLVLGWGLFSFYLLPQQEDPALPGRIARIVCVWPGASAPHYRPLSTAAASLMEELEQIPEVARVQAIGAIGETIELAVAPATLKDHGFSLSQLAGKLGGLGQPVPGTRLPGDHADLPVRLGGGPSTEEQLRALIIGVTPAGAPQRLDEVLAVHRGDQDPLPLLADVLTRAGGGSLARQRSVLLAVEMRSGEVIGQFDRQVRAAVQRLNPQLPAGVEVVTISDQPASVSRRLERFSRCFVEAVLVILLVALLLMEWRAAVIIACAFPLTVAMTLGGMAVAGIPLHQVSIAALIIALGMRSAGLRSGRGDAAAAVWPRRRHRQPYHRALRCG